MANEKEPVGEQVLEPELQIPAKANENFEEQQERKKREDFVKRNAEAIAERRAILKANGLEDDTKKIDPAEVATRCCS